jgi:type I restriction enzyme S subunit
MKRRELEETEEHITRTAIEDGESTLVPKGSLLMVSRSGILAHSIPVAVAGCELAINQDIRAYIPQNENVRSRYLRDLIIGYEDDLLQLWKQQGATVQSLNSVAVSETPIPLPDPSVQDEIIRYCQKYRNQINLAIRKYEKLKTLGENRRRAAVDHLMTSGISESAERETELLGVDSIPEHWETVKIGWIIRSLRNGWSPNASSNPAEGNEYGVLKLSAVSEGEFRPHENKALSPSTEVPEGSIVNSGQVLVTRANTPELVADACTVGQYSQRLIAPDLMFIIEVDSKRVCSRFLSEWLVTLPARNQIRMDAHGSSGSMVKVSQQNLKDWEMPLPPKDEQEEILKQVEQIRGETDTLTDRSSKIIDLLEEKRQALITAAVTGQIDVSDVKNEAKASHT